MARPIFSLIVYLIFILLAQEGLAFSFMGLGEEAEASCGAVDHQARFKQALPFNQGDSKLCYSVVAADLISAAVGQNVSPADVALQNIQDNPENLQGGSVADAISLMTEKGICSEGEMTSAFDEEYGSEKGVPLLERLSEILSKGQSVRGCVVRKKIPYLESKLIFVGDDMRIRPQRERQERFLQKVDRILNDQPLAISYYTGDDCVHCTSGFHVVTLMKRYKDSSGQCMYVLRNSYGVYDEAKNSWGVFVKDGYIHMPRSQALERFLKAQYIKSAGVGI